MSDNLLDSFLTIAANELKKETTTQRQLTSVDIFSDEATVSSAKNNENKLSNAIHNGDTDSSDDEDNKYFEERRYNECGKDLKHLLNTFPSAQSTDKKQSDSTWKSKPAAVQQKLDFKKIDVKTDPIFGLRVINPLISFNVLQERMTGREAVPFLKIKHFIKSNSSEKNWVIAGVIIGKSSVKTSHKGNQYVIWTLSDLRNDIKTVSLFLFGQAYKSLWKTDTGIVVGILNPTVLEKKENSKDEATLSIDTAQKVMILGQSKDFGKCKSVKKDGERCTAVVNTSTCEYCIYHIKQEYQKCSRRSELQSSFAGKGLTALRNKVLGKNEVFYAGKLYTSIPAKRSKKLVERDESLLQALDNNQNIGLKKLNKTRGNYPKVASNLEVPANQRLRDLTLLEKLGGDNNKTTFNANHSSETTCETAKKTVTDVLSKLKSKNIEDIDNSNIKPVELNSKNSAEINLAIKPVTSGVIDLSIDFSRSQMNKAKQNALKFVHKHGKIEKADPNAVKKKPLENKKRVLESIENENFAKKQKVTENNFLSDRFKKIMAASSQNSDLLNIKDNEEQEKYFHKLEVKEKMEEKMISTYKVPCKAVKCLQCKYTNFSASQFCKDNKHPLKVFDSVKRFFKCGKCGNRTVSLDVVPTEACKNCGSGKWERTGMMKEKNIGISHSLSIRGGEQKFINSNVSDANLDLLVPDE